MLFLLTGLMLGLVGTSPAQVQNSVILSAKATPQVVQFGSQPENSPLLLKVEVTRAPSIKEVTVDLSQLSESRYYDPNSNSEKPTSAMTPLYRVYLVDGRPAYRAIRQKSKRRTETIYRAATTHEELEGEVLATRIWQVELPDVGLRQGKFELWVVATDKIGRRSNAYLNLRVVDDLKPPKISASISPLLPAEVARPGDEVLIQASAEDELTKVLRIYLANEAREVLGEEANLSLEKVGDSWELVVQVPEDLTPGTYELRVLAEDRAGNLSEARLKLPVAEDIDSMKLRLKEGWNLISTPRPLVDPRVESVFAGLPAEKVLTYLGGEERKAKKIKAGLGYLVKLREEAELVLKFEKPQASKVPEVIKLPEGWNLIGFASTSLEASMPLRAYLGRDLAEKWVVVYDENLEEARPQPLYPFIWASASFITLTGDPYYKDPSHNLPVMCLGQAYWLYLKDEGILVP